jgi:hypothetical protein
VHIGDVLPEYIFDSIYQTLLINKNSCKIYVIINQSNISSFIKTISNFNLNNYFTLNFEWMKCIETISIESLNDLLKHDNFYQSYLNNISSKYNLTEFRNGFWISTTSRFFYIHCFMKKYNIKQVFHIENDIMLYESFLNIFNGFSSHTDSNNIWVVQDAPDRVVPSILYFPNTESLSNLTCFIAQQHTDSNTFINDMNLLGRYVNKFSLPISPEQWSTIFDGAAIGQYLGGVDIRNTEYSNNKLSYYTNNTIGFINETSVFKPNTCNFSYSSIQTDIHSIPLKSLICTTKTTKKISNVSNIHIHSKQLYQFSSIMNLKYTDIITGDRILSLCDFVITTNGIYQYHKNIDKYANDIILVKNWDNVNIIKLNSYFKQLSITKKTNTISLFLYTHTLELFITYILKHLDQTLHYIIYTHNSDHEFNTHYKKLADAPHIKHIYAQNLEYSSLENSNKLTLLPIGLANSMWPHGDLYSFYTCIKNTYMFNKPNNLYVNINPSTFPYRKIILDKLNESPYNTWKKASSKPYSEYLIDLANHKFCLCIRGNGIDTHRFWESLYLGTIPVIINNKYTQCNNFVKQLKNMNIPFYEIKEDNLDIIISKYPDTYFSNELYTSIMKISNNSIYNNPSLKVSYYKYTD